jgi:hypothetical protein
MSLRFAFVNGVLRVRELAVIPEQALLGCLHARNRTVECTTCVL